MSGTLWAALCYFAAIGVGFMLAEIALLQRLSLVLGHPTYSLLVVLSSLVGAAGIGSLLSDRLPLDRAPACYMYPVSARCGAHRGSAAVAVAGRVCGRLRQPHAHRVRRSGVLRRRRGPRAGFPGGLRIARKALSAETPWLWGINGVGSVLASSLAIAIALSWGLTVLLLCAAACYLLLIPAVIVMRREEGGG